MRFKIFVFVFSQFVLHLCIALVLLTLDIFLELDLLRSSYPEMLIPAALGGALGFIVVEIEERFGL
jgi:hypothetical protein